MKNIINNIINDSTLLAHIDNSRRETIKEHTNLCIQSYEYFNKTFNVNKKIINILKCSKIVNNRNNEKIQFSNYEEIVICNMIEDLIKFHDLGKCNLQFQKIKMNNSKFDDVLNTSNAYSNHSNISTLLFVEYYFDILNNDKNLKNIKFLKYIVLIFANVIYSHHTHLHDLINVFGEDGDYYNIKNELDNINVTYFIGSKFKYLNSEIYKIVGNKQNNKILNNYSYDAEMFYMISKLLYSMLINCDFIATKMFKNNEKLEDYKLDRIENVVKVRNCFKENVVKQNIDKYIKDNTTFDKININTLRCEIAAETYTNLIKYKYKKRIYFIKAPTGSGKTYNRLNCALELLDNDINKILYAFPINAISNQTKDVFCDIFESNLPIYEINSSSEIPLTTKSKEGDVDFNNILLDKQQMNYPFILTSNIKLFDSLFSTSRESNLSLIHLCNSVIVLDEIQNYNNKKWKEIIEMLYAYSDILNLKIIIMSATLPALNELLDIDDDIVNLTPNSNEWFSNPLFRDRVEIDTEIMYKTIEYKDIKEKMIKEINIRNEKENCKSKFLIEFIHKERAREFYNTIKYELDQNEYLILGLDSLDNKIRKDEIIKICQEENTEKNIILVSTQVIEAGVDIDMDLGAKDISFADLDEQFMGRINRNCKKKNCKVFFFNLTPTERIYREDLRINLDILKDDILDVLHTKNFNTYYNKVFNKINNINKTYDDINGKFKEDLKKLNYNNIKKYMTLIDSDNISIYIPKVINYENKIISGYDIWNKYIELLKDNKLEYCEKRIKLHNIQTQMQLFTYNIHINNNIQLTDMTGGYYYLDDNTLMDSTDRLDLDKLYEKLKADSLFI